MIPRIVLGVVMVVHGLIHLLGFVVYWRLSDVEGISYRTALLYEGIPVGAGGARVFGFLWLACALGFVASGVGVLLLRPWWRTLALGVALFSLVVTILGPPDSPYGVAVNAAILAYQLAGARFPRLLPGARRNKERSA